jgi:DNA-binding MarR family transcriptional regulator
MARDRLVLDEFVPYRLSFTSNLVSDTIASIYEALFALRIPEWRLIAVIAENNGITQQEIGVRTRMDKVTVSRAAIALADRSLIERKANVADKRSHLLVLTHQGCELYASVAPKALELERRIFGALDPAERTRFVETLRKIDQIALAIVDDD